MVCRQDSNKIKRDQCWRIGNTYTFCINKGGGVSKTERYIYNSTWPNRKDKFKNNNLCLFWPKRAKETNEKERWNYTLIWMHHTGRPHTKSLYCLIVSIHFVSMPRKLFTSLHIYKREYDRERKREICDKANWLPFGGLFHLKYDSKHMLPRDWIGQLRPIVCNVSTQTCMSLKSVTLEKWEGRWMNNHKRVQDGELNSIKKNQRERNVEDHCNVNDTPACWNK